MSKNTGGPAFPVIESERCESVCEGMTLRDHFAGLAMQGYIAYMGCGPDRVDQIGADDNEPNKTVIARCAYKIADAMLAEREKGNEN